MARSTFSSRRTSRRGDPEVFPAISISSPWRNGSGASSRSPASSRTSRWNRARAATSPRKISWRPRRCQRRTAGQAARLLAAADAGTLQVIGPRSGRKYRGYARPRREGHRAVPDRFQHDAAAQHRIPVAVLRAHVAVDEAVRAGAERQKPRRSGTPSKGCRNRRSNPRPKGGGRSRGSCRPFFLEMRFASYLARPPASDCAG